MGRGFVLTISLFQIIFLQSAFALELRCAGVVAGVHRLGSDTRVVQVETILEARGLTRYSKGLSVQQLLKQSNRFGLLVVRDEYVAGFLVVERKGSYLAIEAIAVAPEFERKGVGRELFNHLAQEGLKMVGIEEIRTLVAYDDTNGRAFFKAMGLNETEIIPGSFDGHTVSGVILKKRIKVDAPQSQLQLQPVLAKPKLSLKLETVAVTHEELLRLDPILAESAKAQNDYD